ncbi:MAG: hypothetical protein FJZ04_01165 [Candidatus Moranbacteria bacterium]|nr:hypothetical protein [Candidatus Moranbacteria bacterium]
MTENGTASQQVPGWYVEFQLAVLRALPRDISQEIADGWRENGKALAKAFREVLFPLSDVPEDHRTILSDWQNFYQQLFGKEYDFSGVRIPEKPSDGRWRLLIIIDLSLEQLYAKCKELFPCLRWTDENLDKIVIRNERDAKNGAYAIWVRDEVEADEDLKGLSANDIEAKKITSETLVERLTHELKFFDETGKHLDVKNITLCAGSRYSVGSIPHVYFNPDHGRVDVYWSHPDYRYVFLRVRQVVS